MSDNKNNRAGFGRYISAYLLACYLYWPTLLVIGKQLYPSFTLAESVPFVHGSISTHIIILFSPVWLPFNLLFGISWRTISYVEENLGVSLTNVCCEWSAFIASLILAYVLVSILSHCIHRYSATKQMDANK